ncbi:hypothetical protein K9U34_04850 [Lawsonia intracellularis]|uniref:NA n=1 Tax=Lawsonia intracellularis (strain PHE/MN1-00) TaxID=363253 RepID=Q1MPI4_LAWIP|nr:hypothetical protein [Lawsonia intracellularis]AGC50472.1 hypothetical protein LAW_01077 [Lawsonia intracellularis N343]KAA0204491.1 hypothetical protein C4K43_05810 [Lawsonia intracellularis]MBZ3892920.1 hypothetical protein [Lawsonia intracellularis]OMQ02939.1 hypothetical protein BW722_05650 [Lawsonia intracellularis]RBN32924.1 hypothetical protein DR194_00570 [Lawsonia intracellularis]
MIIEHSPYTQGPTVATDRNLSSTQQNQRRWPQGISRVLLAIVTLGVSEAVFAIQSYCAQRNQNQQPRVNQTQARQYNKKLLEDMCNPNKEFPYPNAIENAVQKVEEELGSYSEDSPEDILEKALKALKPEVLQLPTCLDEEVFTTIFIQKLKELLLQKVLIEEVKIECDNRGIPVSSTSLLILTGEKPELDISGCISENETKLKVEQAVSKLANTIENKHNSDKAIQNASIKLKNLIANKTGIRSFLVSTHCNYKKLCENYKLATIVLESTIKTKHTENNVPVIPAILFEKLAEELCKEQIQDFENQNHTQISSAQQQYRPKTRQERIEYLKQSEKKAREKIDAERAATLVGATSRRTDSIQSRYEELVKKLLSELEQQVT